MGKRNIFKIKLFIVLSIGFCSSKIIAQTYIIDSSYGTNGLAKIISSDSLCSMRSPIAAVIEPTHKITFIHNHYDDTDVYHITPGTIRFKADGLSVDSAFGNLGIVQKFDLPVSAVSLFNNNISTAIALAYESGYVIGGKKKRYNFNDYTGRMVAFYDDGTVNNNFGNAGIYIDSTYKTYEAFEIHQFNNKYLQLSRDRVRFENIVSMVKQDGTIDSSFGSNGFQIFDMFDTAFTDVEYKSISIIDGSIYVSFVTIDSTNGYRSKNNGLIKLKANGTPDSLFGVNGKAIMNTHSHHKWMSRFGFIVNENFTTAILGSNILCKVEDTTDNKKYICLFNTNGYLDTITFGQNGYALFDPPKNSTSITQIFRLKALSNNKIVILGRTLDTLVNVFTSTYFVALYNEFGFIDSSFGINGYYNLTDSILLADATFTGDILTVDSNHFYISGYNYINNSANYFAGNYCVVKFKNASNNNPTILSNLETGDNLVYPNPFQNYIEIRNANNESIAKLHIYDAKGILISKLVNPTNKLDLSTLPTGIYRLEVYSKYNRHSSCIIKN
jgi:hypothetical protein